MRKPRPRRARRESSPILLLIALFKLLKAATLIAVGIGAIKFLHDGPSATLSHWIEVLRVDPDNRHIHNLLVKVLRISPKQLKELSIGTFVYAGLFLTEGTGLLLRRRWAEYFTIITTGLLIPLEVYELIHHFTAVKLVILIVNALIVWYLIHRVRTR